MPPPLPTELNITEEESVIMINYEGPPSPPVDNGDSYNAFLEVENPRVFVGPSRQPRPKRRRSANDRDDDSVQGPSRSRRFNPHYTPRGNFLREGYRSASITPMRNVSVRTRPSGYYPNILPKFDPALKHQTIYNWLDKVDEFTAFYDWDESEVIHYATTKLSGAAKTWYERQFSVGCPWSVWKERLIAAFPPRPDYAEMLMKMLDRRAHYGECLEEYYYDKCCLLKRCQITGSRAVDCLIQGIDDNIWKMGAYDWNCKVPEDVLRYFWNINPDCQCRRQ